MLTVSNVTKDFPTPTGPLRILENVSFSMAPGEAAAIMGPSGSGKSTLLYILGALDRPTSGSVTLGGEDPFTLKANALAAFRNRRIGFVFQDHALLPQCSVIENVLVPTLVGAPDPEATVAREGPARPRWTRQPPGPSARRNCPAARNSASPSRARWSDSRSCCCATSRRATSTPSRPTPSPRCSSSCTQAQKTVLVVVTHSDALAARFPVRFHLHQRAARPAVARCHQAR